MIDAIEKEIHALFRILKNPKVLIVFLFSLILMDLIFNFGPKKQMAFRLYPEVTANLAELSKAHTKIKSGGKLDSKQIIPVKKSFNKYTNFGIPALDGQISNFYTNLEKANPSYTRSDFEGVINQGNDIRHYLEYYFGCSDLFYNRPKTNIVSQDPTVPTFSLKSYLRYTGFRLKAAQAAVTEIAGHSWSIITSRTETFWTAMSVLTTLLLSFIALWKEILRPQPNLVLEELNFNGKAAPLYITMRTNDPNQPTVSITTPSCFYHAQVRNKKRRVMAKNVMVLCNRKRLLDDSGKVVETIDFYPARSLAWAPREVNGMSADISNHKSLDMIVVFNGKAEIELFTKPSSGEHIIDWGQNTELELEVVADNFSKSTKYRLEITWLSKKSAVVALQPPCGNLKLALSKI